MAAPWQPASTPAIVGRRTLFGMRPGLERMERLVAALDHPQRAYPVIHVAGTNGKGSTSAMIAAILAGCGLRVGLYTSPHLVHYGERIVVDGRPITDEEMASVAAEVELAVEADPGLTEFEIGTALAFCHFRRCGVDAAVVEVGLGGRWDATNVVAPALTVITPVGMDHTSILGDTLAGIAGEKAGIIKEGVPLVLAPQAPEAEGVIVVQARAVGAPVVWAEAAPESVALSLAGRHQRVNAGVAMAAAETLRAMGWPVTEEAIAYGLAHVHWPGRIETVQRDPLVILDGAHNVMGVDALAEALPSLGIGPRSAVLVFGVQTGKPSAAMVRRLQPFCRDVVFTRADGRLPGEDPERIRAAVEGEWTGAVAVERDPHRAFAWAEERAGRDGVIIVSGSLYLVGALRDRWPWPPLFHRRPVPGEQGNRGDGAGRNPVQV